jgi:tetratricopeptide (TPR) repeat protein
MLAEILWLHGYTGASADLLEDLVEHYPVEVYRTWNHDHMRELSALRMNGNTTHGLERWLLANEVYLQSGKYGGIPDGPIRHQVYRLFKEGDSDQALVMLDRMQADAPHFRQCAIELYESGVFTHPDLESLLMEQLEYKRSRGLKIDEPRLYQLYASLLADQGRWEEALRAQRECIRLYEALRIPNRSLAEHATYLTYLYAAGLDELLAAETEVLRKKNSRHSQPIPEWIESRIGVAMALQGPPPTQTLSVPPADLQPTRMQTVTLPGLTVRTRFSLSNPAQVAQTGVLTLNPPATLTEVDESTLQLSWLTPDQAQSTHTITLPPFSEKRLYLLAPLNGDQEGEITLRWQGDRQPNPSVSRWVFSQGERESSIALTNSSRIRQNPFYLVPLYQSLVRAHEEGTERVAFRIVCSHPTRVEVYRETDQRLLYVDNNGDGDLLGSGDVLFGDHENANRPQIEFADGEDLAGLLIYLLPDEGLNQPVEIEVSLWQENQWVPQTVHVWEP